MKKLFVSFVVVFVAMLSTAALAGRSSEPRVLGRHVEGVGEMIYSVAFSPDSKTVASSGSDGNVKIWDVTNGKIIRQLRIPDGEAANGSNMLDVAFSPDGRFIATSGWWATPGQDPPSKAISFVTRDGMIAWMHQSLPIPDNFKRKERLADVRIWDAKTGILRRVITRNGPYPEAIAFSPNSKLLAIAQNNAVRFFDTLTGKLEKSVGSPDCDVTAIAFSPDNKIFATGISPHGEDRFDGEIYLWEIATGELIGKLTPAVNPMKNVTTIAFSPDSQKLASAHTGGQAIVWDIPRKTVLQRVIADEQLATSIAFSPNGKRFATGGWDGLIKIYDISGNLAISFKIPDRLFNDVESVAFSPDGKTIACARQNGVIYLWRLQ